MFNDVPLPDIEGLDSFEGKTIHSARWDWDHDLAGETVGVIGSAASAVQLVPETALEVGQLHVFPALRQLGAAQRRRPLTPPREMAARQADPSIVVARRDELFEQVDTGMAFKDPNRRAEMEAIGLRALESVTRPRTAGQAHPHPHVGLQAPAVPQRVLHHLQPPERGAGDRRHREDHPQGGPHQRRKPNG